MNDFIYDIGTKVYFGKDQLKNLGKELKNYGPKVLLTYGGGSIKKSGLYEKVVEQIKGAGLKLFELSGIDPNPRVDSVREGARICKEEGIDVLLAVGGGSVIDCTKFIGAATYYDGDAWDLSTGKAAIEKCLPILTVLTLSATGSEMDAGGVISNPKTNDKLGNGAPCMRPKVSFLDPTNSFTVSPYQTAAGSADIMNHILEVYFNPNKDLELLDRMMEGLLKTIIKFAPIAMNEPENYEARANLMWASSWAINGFIDGGKEQPWSCHPMEHELSAYYDITHGHGLAILTPRWLSYCLDESNVNKYYQYGINVWGLDPTKDPMIVAKESIQRTADFLFKDLALRSSLSELGIGDEKFALMAEKAAKIGQTEDGFKPLNAKDIEKIYQMCL